MYHPKAAQKQLKYLQLLNPWADSFTQVRFSYQDMDM